MIAWEGNNYPFKRSAGTRSDVDSILRIKNHASNSDPTRISDASLSHNENRGQRRARDNPRQSRGSRVCCMDERAYVYTCMYVSGGHGF